MNVGVGREERSREWTRQARFARAVCARTTRDASKSRLKRVVLSIVLRCISLSLSLGHGETELGRGEQIGW